LGVAEVCDWLAARGYGGKDKGDVEKGRFLALIGNVLSFAIAIGVGLALNPAAREIWAKPHG
jgi:hypothetical protein